MTLARREQKRTERVKGHKAPLHELSGQWMKMVRDVSEGWVTNGIVSVVPTFWNGFMRQPLQRWPLWTPRETTKNESQVRSYICRPHGRCFIGLQAGELNRWRAVRLEVSPSHCLLISSHPPAFTFPFQDWDMKHWGRTLKLRVFWLWWWKIVFPGYGWLLGCKCTSFWAGASHQPTPLKSLFSEMPCRKVLFMLFILMVWHLSRLLLAMCFLFI